MFQACKDNLDFDEIAKTRKEFNSLSWVEKNTFMLSQLHVFARHSNQSRSARQIKNRVRQKFDYHISIDRPVCKKVFLFYYGETLERLKRLQKHKLDVGISTTAHGNTGRLPSHACSIQDIDPIKQFIISRIKFAKQTLSSKTMQPLMVCQILEEICATGSGVYAWNERAF
jgi:hypothetical protein